MTGGLSLFAGHSGVQVQKNLWNDSEKRGRYIATTRGSTVKRYPVSCDIGVRRRRPAHISGAVVMSGFVVVPGLS